MGGSTDIKTKPVFSAFAAVMLHMHILQEEKFPAERFGDAYIQYEKRTFRYLGSK